MSCNNFFCSSSGNFFHQSPEPTPPLLLPPLEPPLISVTPRIYHLHTRPTKNQTKSPMNQLTGMMFWRRICSFSSRHIRRACVCIACL
jgi:hypothetical protein